MSRSILIWFYAKVLVCCFLLVTTALSPLYADSNESLDALKLQLSEAQNKLYFIDKTIIDYPSAKKSKSIERSKILDEISRLKSEIAKLKNNSADPVYPAPNDPRSPSGDNSDQGNDTQPVSFGNYHAIVIGNNNYKYMPILTTAVNDAKEVERLLRNQYGFRVTLILNAERSDIFSALSKVRRELESSDNLLIYYAGHGILDKPTNRGYWLPVNAEPNNKTNWVPNEDITSELNAIMARHVLIVADSCYSGTLTRSPGLAPMRTGPLEKWVRRMANRRSRTVLTSGALEPVLDAGGGDHSVFAQAFLRTLQENQKIIDMDTLYKSIRSRVVDNARQTPIYSCIRFAGHDYGDFILVPR